MGQKGGQACASASFFLSWPDQVDPWQRQFVVKTRARFYYSIRTRAAPELPREGLQAGTPDRHSPVCHQQIRNV